MRTVQRIRKKGNATRLLPAEPDAGLEGVKARVAMIQALIPLGLEAVGVALPGEVVALAGERYARCGGRPELVRWGQQRGSVYLADQKLPVRGSSPACARCGAIAISRGSPKRCGQHNSRQRTSRRTSTVRCRPNFN